MLDGYENPNPTTPPPEEKHVKPLVLLIPVISDRILKHIDSLERLGETARHSAFVVIPSTGIWRKMGNKTFYRLFNLRYMQHGGKKNGIQEAINKAKSRIFIKDSSYNCTTALTLAPGIALDGESMPQITNVEPTPPEANIFTTNANGDTGTVLTTTGNNDCFTGNLLRTVSITNMGLSNFTNGFNIGKANTLGIVKGHIARILFSNVATPINVQNFQYLRLDQIYAWLPTTNFIQLTYAIRQASGFDFSLQKNATTQAPSQNILVFHSNVAGTNCKVQSDNFNNFLITPLPLLPVTGSYPSGISGVGMATFGGVNFTTMFGGGSGQNMVGHATSNIPGGTQTGPITIVTDQVPGTQQCEVGGSFNVTSYTSGTIQLQVTYTDQNNNAQTVTIPLTNPASPGNYVSGAAATGIYNGYVPICSKPNTTYTLKTVGTFTANYYCCGFCRATG